MRLSFLWLGSRMSLSRSRVLQELKNRNLPKCHRGSSISRSISDSSHKKSNVDIDKEDRSSSTFNLEEYERMVKEAEEAARLEELQNVSGLSPEQYHIFHGVPPKLPYKDLTCRRKLYARYGSASGEDPRIMWPSRREIFEMMEDDKLEELPLHEKMSKLQAERNVGAKEHLERHKMIEKNMAHMSKWIKDYKERIQAAEDEVSLKKKKKEALLDEARDYFGYKIKANDPKFQKMIEDKEVQEKKDAKERKKKEKARKAAERLKQDVLLMGLKPEESKGS